MMEIYRAYDAKRIVTTPGGLNIDITAPAESYYLNNYGLYNMVGNVEEMVAEEGITRGGSYMDPGYYMQNNVSQTYVGRNCSSKEMGFRLAMDVIVE